MGWLGDSWDGRGIADSGWIVGIWVVGDSWDSRGISLGDGSRDSRDSRDSRGIVGIVGIVEG